MRCASCSAKKVKGISRVLASCIALMPALVAGDVELRGDEQSSLVLKGTVAGAGFFGSDSWFGESESFLGASTDTWGEFGAELGLAWEYSNGGKTTWFAELSGVYTATGSDDASGLTIGEPDTDEANTEQAHIGLRYDDPFTGLEGDTFTFSVGRQDYLIGTGLLIADGGSDGGSRGGWYLGLRKTFQETVIASLKSDTLVAEGFFLKNRPRRGGTQGKAYGANLEYTFPRGFSAGTSYMTVDARLEGEDDLDVWSGRLGWAGLGGLELGGEYVIENSNTIDADGWYGQIGWSFADAAWSPVVTYRYADFDGDDPLTADDERFREIAYGYTDYGYWYQGEISGNYPLANGNLKSNMLRVKATPSEAWTLNLFYYDFKFNHPRSLDPFVTSDDWGDEINFTADWALDDHWYLIGVAAILFPGDAARQWVGGNDDWLYSMVYVSYSF